MRAEDASGRPLLVKVYGRDAYDSQLLAKLWRTLWYQGGGPRLRLSRVQAVEHEALVTLLAAQAGVPTRTVVTAARRRPATRCSSCTTAPPSRASRRTRSSPRGGARSRGSATAGIAHLQIEPAALALVDGEPALVDFDGATLSPRPDQLETDRAQLLAATAVLAGPERALAAAQSALGDDGLAALLPYLQAGAFGVPLRQALKERGVDVDELRAAAAEAVGAEEPELVRLRRVTWWTLVQIALLALAVWTILAALGGLDYDQLRESLDGASWWWVAAGFVIAQLPRLTQAVSTLGSVPARLAFRPVYVMQLATGYMNLALPSSLARMAVNIRFFQRQGIPPTRRRHRRRDRLLREHGDPGGDARAAAALLEREPEPEPRGAVGRLAAARGRRRASWWSRRSPRCCSCRASATRSSSACARWWPEVRSAVLGLRGSDKLGLLLGGSLATELLFATALGVFANALGYDISLADLLVMNISVSLLGSFVPIPGNIGVAELGLTVGLVSGGHDRGGGARRGAALPRGDVLHPAGLGLLRHALAPAQRTRSRVAAMTWVLIVVLVLLVLIALWLILLYNGLVQKRNRVDNAWAQIDVQLRRRRDLIPNLVETVKGYAAHERGTFEAVTEARAAAANAQNPAEAGRRRRAARARRSAGCSPSPRRIRS